MSHPIHEANIFLDQTASAITHRSTALKSRASSVASIYAIIGALVLAVILAGFWGWLEMTNREKESALIARLIAKQQEIMIAQMQTNIPTEIAPPTVPATFTQVAMPLYIRERRPAYSPGIQPAAAQPPNSKTDASPSAPSIDCANVSSAAEQLICSDRDLSGLDIDMGIAYSNAINKADDKEQLAYDQHEWIKNSRNTCADTNCMTDAFNQRISELSK